VGNREAAPFALDWLRSTPDELATPPMYIAFDVLYRASKDVADGPLGDRRVLRAGGAKHIDVRIIAATNQDFPGMCRLGRFRASLYVD
jgi:Sigma-54 interaction domain